MGKENNWKVYKESEDEKFRKEMSVNPDKDPPVIMSATDAVALYPSLEKHKTAKRIRCFIEKSGVNFDDINASKNLVYLKLNKQILFFPTPKIGKEKHMSHSTVKGPHTASELKKLKKRAETRRRMTGIHGFSKKN